MKQEEKQKIKLLTEEYIKRFSSQNAAANSLKGVSAATLSQLMNGKWELINDKMWRNIAAQVGYENQDWKIVETRDFRAMLVLLNDAQKHSNVYAITAEAGSGKSATAKHYAASNPNAFLLQCNEYWNRKDFMSELLQAMGKDFTGYNVSEMMQLIVTTLQKEESPLIIMDEADKLSDSVLYFFITLYNKLEDQCGILLCATDHLEKRIRRGMRLNRKGYKEIFSRIGRKFIVLKGAGRKDVELICEANGIDVPLRITEIFNESEGDLRRVKRMVHRERLQAIGQEGVLA